MTSERLREIVLGTLRLREWVLGSARLGAAPVVSESSWTGFLQMERCAARLRRRLDAASRPVESAEARAVLDEYATRDVQRDLAVRAQLRELSAIASGGGWPVLILKGAVAPATGAEPIALLDIDVLTGPDEALPLAAALEKAGYEPRGGSSPFHLRGLYAKGQVPIEIHLVFADATLRQDRTIWDRAVALEDLPSLLRLAPRDDLWNLLTHAAFKHPDRRGALRDLLLTADAVERCDADDLSQVRARAEGHVHADLLGRLLTMTQALAEGTEVHDMFRTERAVAMYAVAVAGRLPAPAVVRGDVGNWILAWLSGSGERHRRWGEIFMVTLEPSLSRPIAWVETRSPGLGRIVRVKSRALRHTLAALIAVPLALWVRSAARRSVGEFPAEPDQPSDMPAERAEASRPGSL